MWGVGVEQLNVRGHRQGREQAGGGVPQRQHLDSQRVRRVRNHGGLRVLGEHGAARRLRVRDLDHGDVRQVPESRGEVRGGGDGGGAAVHPLSDLRGENDGEEHDGQGDEGRDDERLRHASHHDFPFGDDTDGAPEARTGGGLGVHWAISL